MERRFGRNLSGETMSLRQNPSRNENVPDLTDFINDMFFGTVKVEKKEYNLTGTIDNRRQERAEEESYDSSVRSNARKGTPRFVNDYSRGEEDFFDSSTRYSRVGLRSMEDDEDFESSTRSVSSRLTQEWLKEAKRMVANSSPGRGGCESPGRLVGSPRFATCQGRLSVSSNAEKRDSFSRSARRGRTVDGFSEEILIKSAKQSNKSETTLDHSSPESPASAVNKWFSGILKPPNSPVSIPDSPAAPDHAALSPNANQTNLALPPRQSTLRKSRFQNASHTHSIPPQTNQFPLPKRTFKPPAAANTLPDFFDSSRRRSTSSAACSAPNGKILSPPRKLVESVHRRCISASTCSMDKIYQKNREDCGQIKEKSMEGEELNGFLRDQRQKIGMILNREIDVKAKIVLSGHSNSTSSMVAAICYAMLLENRTRTNKEEDESNIEVVVPVMNIARANMWKQQQAAWLFHHVGLDVKALFFFDEVDLETLTESKQVIIQVAGEDVLKTNGEVVSECTVLTDNYCEEAYDLLQTPMLKKLLLAGILLDTRNLMLSAAKVPMKTRDAEAVQLLTVGTAPDYKNTLFDQLMQDHKDNNSFNEALQQSYGEPPAESKHNEEPLEQQVSEKSSNRRQSKSDKNSSDTKNSRSSKASSNTGKPKPSPKEVPAPTPPKAVDPPRPKNKFFLAKWFGFGSK